MRLLPFDEDCQYNLSREEDEKELVIIWILTSY